MSLGPRAKIGNTCACEWDFRVRVMTTMTASERTLLRSQSGPGARVAFSAALSNCYNRIESHLFRVLLQRRLRLRLPLSSAACSRGARMCKEAGGRVATNVMVRDLDTAVLDPRGGRLEIVVDGLPLFGCSLHIGVSTHCAHARSS